MLGISGNPFYVGRKAIDNAWSPNSASVPTKLWYRGSDVVLNVSNVSEWTNKSGSVETARHQTQATPALQPGYSASDAAYNNQPLLTFDGNQYLDSGTFAAPIIGPVSLLCVGECDIIRTFVSKGADAPDYNNLGIVFAGNVEYYQSSGFIDSTTLYDNTPSVILLTDDGVGEMNLYINDFTVAQQTTTITYQSTDTISVGRGNAGLANCLGKIAEVVFWDGELNATDLNNLKTYLNNRYNLGVI